MSIKAILTVASLLVGSSSLAFAQRIAPYPQPYVAPASPYGPPAYRYNPAPYHHRYANPAPGFGAPSAFINGRAWIDLGGATGRISLYTYGTTFVRSIDVYYLNGSVRRVRVRRGLDPASPRLDILIGRQPIRGISVRGGGAGVSAGAS